MIAIFFKTSLLVMLIGYAGIISILFHDVALLVGNTGNRAQVVFVEVVHVFCAVFYYHYCCCSIGGMNIVKFFWICITWYLFF